MLTLIAAPFSLIKVRRETRAELESVQYFLRSRLQYPIDGVVPKETLVMVPVCRRLMHEHQIQAALTA